MNIVRFHGGGIPENIHSRREEYWRDEGSRPVQHGMSVTQARRGGN